MSCLFHLTLSYEDLPITLFLELNNILLYVCMCVYVCVHVCVYIYIYIYTQTILFFLLSVNGNLGSFYLLAIVNNAAMNIGGPGIYLSPCLQPF